MPTSATEGGISDTRISVAEAWASLITASDRARFTYFKLSPNPAKCLTDIPCFAPFTSRMHRDTYKLRNEKERNCIIDHFSVTFQSASLFALYFSSDSRRGIFLVYERIAPHPLQRRLRKRKSDK